MNNEKMVSKKQLKAIRYNYWKKSQKTNSKKDIEIIFSTILGIPGKSLILFLFWVATQWYFFLLGFIIVGALEIWQFHQALIRIVKQIIGKITG